MVDVVAVCPGEISAVVFALDADDQSEVHGAPEKSAANGPARKLCICEAEMLAAAGSVGDMPKAVWNAWSTAVLADEVGVEK